MFEKFQMGVGVNGRYGLHVMLLVEADKRPEIGPATNQHQYTAGKYARERLRMHVRVVFHHAPVRVAPY